MIGQQSFSGRRVSGRQAKKQRGFTPAHLSPQNRVFAEALLENSTTRQRRSPMDWALSFFIHFAILFVLLFLPLYFSQGIDMKRLETTLLVAPMPPMAPAPPAPPRWLARSTLRRKFSRRGSSPRQHLFRRPFQRPLATPLLRKKRLPGG